MIGLYYLPIPTICHELCLDLEGASEALGRAFEGGFARYDTATETVFVHEMARFQVGENLHPKDNRVIAVEKLLYQYRKSVFFKDFMERYGKPFCLSEKGILGRHGPPSKGLPTGPGAGSGPGVLRTPLPPERGEEPISPKRKRRRVHQTAQEMMDEYDAKKAQEKTP
jgi:hypothetical protein